MVRSGEPDWLCRVSCPRRHGLLVVGARVGGYLGESLARSLRPFHLGEELGVGLR